MAELDPLELTSRQEKILILVAVFVSVIIHLAFLFGSLMELKTAEKEEEERMMIIHRLPDIITPEQIKPTIGREPQKRDAVIEKGKAPEGEDKEQRSREEQELEARRTPTDRLEKPIEQEKKESAVTILTDLNEAFFRLEGPLSYKGAGTFWERKGLPPGDYRVVFGTVKGYLTPEPQSGSLVEGNALVFIGRYTRMTQVSVETNIKPATYRIIRPDGRDLLLDDVNKGMFKGLPQGSYTIIFNDVAGYLTPGPQTKNLDAQGILSFSGYYIPLGKVEKQEVKMRGKSARRGAYLDRRIKMVVKSYPETEIEEKHGIIDYPEIEIKKADYQEGWCQVYIRAFIDEGGRVENMLIERPRPDDQKKFTLLINTVKKSVRTWDFEPRRAEVHVDVRFYVEK